MATEGDFYGFSIETENTQSLFRGFSIELDVNLIITVLSSDGVTAIDNTATVTILDASDDSQINTGNTKFGVFSDFISTPTALKITATHPAEGSKTVTLVHDGSTVTKVTISFTPSVIKFSSANDLRVVITTGPESSSGTLKTKIFKELGCPYFSNTDYYQPVTKTDIRKLQFQSNYDQNTLQFYSMDGSTVGGVINSKKVINFTTAGTEVFDVYEFELDFSDFSDGRYYFIISGSDTLEGIYTARSEPIEVVSSTDGLVEIDYWNNDNTFTTFYSTGIKHKVYHKGVFLSSANSSQAEPFTDSGGNVVKISDITTLRRSLVLFKIPFYIRDIIDIALGSDNLTINGESCVGVEKIAAPFAQLYEPRVEVAVTLSTSDRRNVHDVGS